MVRVSLRIALLSLVTLALAAPAFAYNVVNTSWTVQCLFSTSCSVTVTDYGAYFSVPGGSGNGHLQSRIYQGQPGTVGAGKWVYEYRIDLTQVAGITYIPYADELAIYNWGTLRQYDFTPMASPPIRSSTSPAAAPGQSRSRPPISRADGRTLF
jgi:hypothetical protein